MAQPRGHDKMHTILIVDDDTQLLTILRESLKKHKHRFQIIEVPDGLAAIKVLQKQPISLVVTDIQMPVVNGLVLLAYMNKNFPHIPCIIMTAHGSPFLSKRLQQMATHYIEKPFKVKELTRQIMSALGQQEDLRGTLSGVTVGGFLKLIELECITCLCEISSRDGQRGYLIFDEGILYDAYFDVLRGESAALKLLEMEDVTIKFKTPPKREFPRRIRTRLSSLLNQALRSREESASREGQGHVGTERASRETSGEILGPLKSDESLLKAIEGAEIIEMQFSLTPMNNSSKGTRNHSS